MAIGRSDITTVQNNFDKTVTPLRKKTKGQDWKMIIENRSYVALVSPPPRDNLANAGRQRDLFIPVDSKSETVTPSPGASPPRSPDGGINYAGAKFNVPPAAAALPKPPVHWTGGGCQPFQTNFTSSLVNCGEMSNCLKILLNVHA